MKELNKTIEKIFYPPFYKKFFWRVKKFFNKIKSLFEWLPIIWRNEDWDYAYFLDLLTFKLNRMEKYFSQSYITPQNQITTKQIKEILRLLKRVREDEYVEEVKAEFNFEEKYGEHQMNFGEKDKNNCTRVIFFYVKGGQKISDELKEEADKLYREIINIADKRRKKECEKAFKIISKSFFNWWD